MQVLETIKITFNNKFIDIGEKVENNKMNIDDLRKDVDELKNNSIFFKQNITILFEKIEELKKLINSTNNDEVRLITIF